MMNFVRRLLGIMGILKTSRAITVTSIEEAKDDFRLETSPDIVNYEINCNGYVARNQIVKVNAYPYFQGEQKGNIFDATFVCPTGVSASCDFNPTTNKYEITLIFSAGADIGANEVKITAECTWRNPSVPGSALARWNAEGKISLLGVPSVSGKIKQKVDFVSSSTQTLDNECEDIILVTNSSGRYDGELFLPTASNNDGRLLRIYYGKGVYAAVTNIKIKAQPSDLLLKINTEWNPSDAIQYVEFGHGEVAVFWSNNSSWILMEHQKCINNN